MQPVFVTENSGARLTPGTAGSGWKRHRAGSNCRIALCRRAPRLSATVSFESVRLRAPARVGTCGDRHGRDGFRRHRLSFRAVLRPRLVVSPRWSRVRCDPPRRRRVGAACARPDGAGRVRGSNARSRTRARLRANGHGPSCGRPCVLWLRSSRLEPRLATHVELDDLCGTQPPRRLGRDPHEVQMTMHLASPLCGRRAPRGAP